MAALDKPARRKWHTLFANARQISAAIVARWQWGKVGQDGAPPVSRDKNKLIKIEHTR